MKNNKIIEEKKEYQWSQSWASRIAHMDIAPIIEELKIIEEFNGKITPQLVVDSAKNKKSSLHRCFDWDNATAAEKWRLRQASTILGHIEVKIIKDNEPRMVRAFVISQTGGCLNGGEPVYHNLSNSDEKTKSLSVRLVLSNLNSSILKLLTYPEFSEAINHMEKAIEILNKTPEVVSIKPKKQLEKVV